jgi:hypothetical protein
MIPVPIEPAVRFLLGVARELVVKGSTRNSEHLRSADLVSVSESDRAIYDFSYDLFKGRA